MRERREREGRKGEGGEEGRDEREREMGEEGRKRDKHELCWNIIELASAFSSPKFMSNAGLILNIITK